LNVDENKTSIPRPGVLIEAPTGRIMPLLTELQHVSRQRFYRDVTPTEFVDDGTQ